MKPRAKIIERRAGILGAVYELTDELGTYTMTRGWNIAWSHRKVRDWRDSIRVGDVLKGTGNSYRVVREAHYKQDGFLSSVTFTIKHCSWTGACYTLLTRSDISVFGYTPTGAKSSLSTDMDATILKNIRRHSRGEEALDCCDVKGIA